VRTLVSSLLVAAYVLGQPTAQAQDGASKPARVVLPPDAQAEPYDPERGVPPGYHLEMGIRKWLFFGGGGLFLASYAMVLVKATSPGQKDNAGLLVPLAGPFIYLAGDPGERAGWAIVGLGQLVGATAFILSLKYKVPWIVPDEQDTAYISPILIGRNGYGGGLGFRF
jgi:hypothetical protein